MSRAHAIWTLVAAVALSTAASAAEFTVAAAAQVSAKSGDLEITVPKGTSWTSSLGPGESYSVSEREEGGRLTLVIGGTSTSDISLARTGPQLKITVTDKAPPGAAPPASSAPAVAAAKEAAAPAAGAATASAAGTGTGTTAAPSPLIALIPGADQALSNYQNYLVDMTVPTTPAFTILGITPKTIIEPTSARDFAMSLAQNLSNSDALGDGVGFDVAPYMLAYGKTFTLAQYQASRMLQTLARTQVSLAAARTKTATDTVSKAGLGLSVPLLDEGDGRLAGSPLGKCYSEALREWGRLYFPAGKVPSAVLAAQTAKLRGDEAGASAALKPITDDLSSRFDACRDGYKKNFWNASKWSAGWGQAYQHSAGATHNGAGAFWTTYAIRLGAAPEDIKTAPVGPQGQVLLHVRRTIREDVADAALPSGFNTRDSTLAAIGIKLGSPDLLFSAQGSSSWGRYATGESERARQVAIGAEYRVAKNTWLVLTVGGKGGYAHEKNTPFVLGSLKFGAESESSGFAAGPKK
jgi:hypothetical protein